jgi:hypothetical protein
MSRQIRIGLAALIAAGRALNWHWLLAAGILPVLFGDVPCLVMCALYLCSKDKGNTSTTPSQPSDRP